VITDIIPYLLTESGSLLYRTMFSVCDDFIDTLKYVQMLNGLWHYIHLGIVN